MGDEGFSWTGTLDETDIRSIYGACHNLRFSGWLELKDQVHEAKVLFLGGDPVEISGGDTQRISMWKVGRFRAVQKIPDFHGELMDALEIKGTLAATKPSSLWAWISQYRLSCEIELERPGSKALVTFQNGHAESAQVNGMPELAALARVSSWTDGNFRVKLRPLFAEGVVVAVPSMPDSAPSDVLHVGRKEFDVSRAVQLDPHPRTPWPGERSEPEGRVESTARTRNDLRRSNSEELAPEIFIERKGSTWPWLLVAALVGAAGGAVALYQYHLPPFSPPPKPITEPPLKPELQKPESLKPEAIQPKLAQPEPSPAAPVKEPEKPVAPIKEPVKEPETKVEPKQVEPKQVEPKQVEPNKKAEPAEEKHDKDVEKLVQKGRLLLINGHSHSAIDTFKKAQKLQPKNAKLRVYEDQANGKLGHAEVTFEGKGAATIDGKKFTAPKKIKLPAGPHDFDIGEGEFELSLKRGEKKKLRVKK